ncbi:MAG: sigma-54 dependent transcriptional regulator [Desulfovibrionales bacterium]|nr:sigma-54 dependent transcriptional regulator [Desulfovibrionales bacterium]
MRPCARILVVDDELSMREFFKLMLDSEGYQAECVPNGREAVSLAQKSFYDLVITDIRMPGMDGIEVLKRVKEISPETIVIMISAYATTETAVTAMKQGAYDYIPKPFNVEEIKLIIQKALEKRQLRQENDRLKEELRKHHRYEKLVGSSPAMLKVYEMIRKVARTRSNVLIYGESGTGKELVARAIHAESPRNKENFVAINCGGIPETLIESELFGHKKGAFTGAISDQKGLFAEADGGTIFLDEIAELSPALQVKLLRVLQERVFRPVGGTEDIAVDIRIISATNKDLEQEVAAGNFREDLFYRLNVIQIRVPPLRERKEDIPLLLQHFLKKYANETLISQRDTKNNEQNPPSPPFTKGGDLLSSPLGKNGVPSIPPLEKGDTGGFSDKTRKQVDKISPAALKILMQYDFPGNVRELENIIERSVALASSSAIQAEDLSFININNGKGAKIGTPPVTIPSDGFDLEKYIARTERDILLKALEISRGAKQKAAGLLGISFRSFRHRLSKYGL